MLLGWLVQLVMEGLDRLEEWLSARAERHRALKVVATPYSFFVIALELLMALLSAAVVLTVVVAFVWVVLWQKALSRVPWRGASWWMWVAGASALALLFVGRRMFGRTWIDAWFDEKPAIGGALCWRNRRLSARIWSQLDRVGVTRQRCPHAYVLVSGEVGLAAVSFPSLTSSVRIGKRTIFGRFVAWTGGGADEGRAWRGAAAVALRRLKRLPDGAGAAAFWEVFPERSTALASNATGS